MEGAILFSEAHTIAQEHPDVVAALREILSRPGRDAPPAHTFSQRLALLEGPGPTQEAAFALLQYLQEKRPALSYLEALGLLLAAAAPTGAAERLEPAPETVDRVSRIFDQLVEQWAVWTPENGAQKAAPVSVDVSPLLVAAAAYPSEEHELGSALSRALARSAREAEVEPHAIQDSNANTPEYEHEIQEHKAPSTPLETTDATNSRTPLPVVTTPEPASVVSKTTGLLPALEPFHPGRVPKSRPPAPPNITLNDNQHSHPTLTGIKAWHLEPRLLVIGSLVLGILLAFTLFRLGAHVSTAPAGVPLAGTPPAMGATPPAAVATPRPKVANGGSAAPADTSPHARAARAGKTVSPSRKPDTRAPANTEAAVHGPGSPPVGSAPSAHSANDSLIPVAHAVSLGTPNPLVANDGRLPGVTVGSAGAMAANVLVSPAPAYPAEARAAHVQGEVIVEAVVGKNGDVLETRVVSGPVLLQAAAQHAVQRWRYRPYLADGKPAEILATARIEFRLH